MWISSITSHNTRDIVLTMPHTLKKSTSGAYLTFQLQKPRYLNRVGTLRAIEMLSIYTGLESCRHRTARHTNYGPESDMTTKARRIRYAFSNLYGNCMFIIAEMLRIAWRLSQCQKKLQQYQNGDTLFHLECRDAADNEFALPKLHALSVVECSPWCVRAPGRNRRGWPPAT